ncbi:MAG: hypothetical protein IIA27_08670 [Gemmatimonadetes bacterium]|nr:hypothetical protein [Gemmatimonadota bacterium]
MPRVKHASHRLQPWEGRVNATHYHTVADTVDKIDFDRMTWVVDGIASVVRQLASED